MLGRSLTAVTLALSLSFGPTAALAKGKPKGPAPNEHVQAVKADKEGQALEKKKSLEDAKAAYEKSLELEDNAETRIRLAGVDAKLGHFLAAQSELDKALAAKKLSFGAKAKAQSLKKSLEQRTPSLVIELPKGFSGKVSIDDEAVDTAALALPVPVDPGSHRVRAEAEGYKPYNESVELQEKEKKNLTILLSEVEHEAAPAEESKPAPKPEKHGSTGKTVGYVSLAIGGVAVGVGVYMGLKARSTKADLDNNCLANVCPPDQRDTYDRGKQQANIATGAFIVGAVGIGLGTVLLLTSGKSDKDVKAEAKLHPHATPYVGPGSVGVYGSF